MNMSPLDFIQDLIQQEEERQMSHGGMTKSSLG